MKEYKKLTLLLLIWLISIVLLKIAFTSLGNNYRYFSLRDFFTSVLNTENIVSLTNESRKAVGLNVLNVNSKLESAAQKKADDMLKNQYFSHTSPSGRVAWDFMDDAEYNYLFAGENLAMNFNSAEKVTEGWLASVSHRENILSDKYTQIGIGVAAGKFLGADSTIVVQMFGKPLQSSAFIRSIAHSKRPMPLTARSASRVKGPSLKRYISHLVQNNVAEWMPFARTDEIYAVFDTGIPMKGLFDMFFAYIVACGSGVFAWRFFREKQYRNKKLKAYVLFVFAVSLILVNL